MYYDLAEGHKIPSQCVNHHKDDFVERRMGRHARFEWLILGQPSEERFVRKETGSKDYERHRHEQVRCNQQQRIETLHDASSFGRPLLRKFQSRDFFLEGAVATKRCGGQTLAGDLYLQYRDSVQ